MARRLEPDLRSTVERMALDLAFDANAVVELGDGAPRPRDDVLAGAAELARCADALARELGEDDKVVRFARLVLGGLDREFDGARAARPRRT
jgi:hypothetical protein